MNIHFQPFPNLSTDRLQLRQLQLEDAPEIFIQRSDPRMLEFIEINISKNLDDARQFIQRIDAAISGNQSMYWAIAQQGNPKLIGTICLWNLSVENESAEVGFAMNPESQGQGYMQEALKAVLDYGFGTMGARVIKGFAHPMNVRSIRLLEKFQFVQKGEKEGYLAWELSGKTHFNSNV